MSDQGPIDPRPIYMGRLEQSLESVATFHRAVVDCVESGDWAGATQSVHALVSSAVQALESVAVLYLLHCTKTGHYKSIRKRRS